MASFLDILRGVINTNPLAKDNPLDLRNIIKPNNNNSTGSNVQDPSASSTIGADSGSTKPEIVIPKAPAFKTPDPIWRKIHDSNMDEDTKDRLWIGYLDDMSHFSEEHLKDFRKELGTDPNTLKWYYDRLLQRDMRGELEPLFDYWRRYNYPYYDERGNLWEDPVMRWRGNFDTYHGAQRRSSTGTGLRRNI